MSAGNASVQRRRSERGPSVVRALPSPAAPLIVQWPAENAGYPRRMCRPLHDRTQQPDSILLCAYCALQQNGVEVQDGSMISRVASLIESQNLTTLVQQCNTSQLQRKTCNVSRSCFLAVHVALQVISCNSNRRWVFGLATHTMESAMLTIRQKKRQ